MQSILDILQSPWGGFGFFLLGLFTSLHCICMCGPLSSILYSYKPGRSLQPLVLYHGSRILSYTWLGWILAMVGFQLEQVGLLKVFAFAVIVFLVLLAMGQSGWVLAPFSKFQSFLLRTISSFPYKTMVLGFLSPLLPCAPLYAALAASTLAPHPLHAGLWMTSFALGTIPLLFAQQLGIHHLGSRLVQKSRGIFFQWLSLLTAGFLLWMHFLS